MFANRPPLGLGAGDTDSVATFVGSNFASDFVNIGLSDGGLAAVVLDFKVKVGVVVADTALGG